MIEFNEAGWSGLASSWPLEAKKPLLVFLHCAGYSATLWRPVLELGELPYQWVAPNLPGRDSNQNLCCSSVADMAAAIEGFVNDLTALDVVLVGHSLGGAVSLQLLTNSPPWLRGAVLVGTGARLRVLPQMLNMVATNYEAYRAHSAQIACGSNSDVQQVSRWAQELAVQDSAIALADFTACNSFDLLGQLDAVNNPVLVLHGDEDQVTPLKFGAYLADHLSNSRLVTLKGAGHMLPLEQPKRVHEESVKFAVNILG